MAARSKHIRSVTSAALGAVVLAGTGAASAAEDRGGLHNGETLSRGTVMPFIEAGWPDVTLGVAVGVTNRFDIGARLSLVYGPYYAPAGALMYLGGALSVPLRFAIAKGSEVSALVHLDPGAKIPWFRELSAAVQFPVGVEVGVRLSEELTFQLGLDVPMHVNVAPTTYFFLAPMMGPGVEYHAGKLVVGLNSRIAVTIGLGERDSFVWYGLLGQMYLGYRI